MCRYFWFLLLIGTSVMAKPMSMLSTDGGSSAICNVVVVSNSSGLPSSLSVTCSTHTTNNREFAIAIGGNSATALNYSAMCSGIGQVTLDSMSEVFNPAGANVTTLFPKGIIFRSQGEINCNITWDQASTVFSGVFYFAGMFNGDPKGTSASGYENRWQISKFETIDKNSRSDYGSIQCSITNVPQGEVSLGVIEPNGASALHNIDVGVECSDSGNRKFDSDINYSLQFHSYTCHDNCSLIGTYTPSASVTADPTDDPLVQFTIHDKQHFSGSSRSGNKTYQTTWQIKDDSGNPREVNASAAISLYYY